MDANEQQAAVALDPEAALDLWLESLSRIWQSGIAGDWASALPLWGALVPQGSGLGGLWEALGEQAGARTTDADRWASHPVSDVSEQLRQRLAAVEQDVAALREFLAANARPGAGDPR